MAVTNGFYALALLFFDLPDSESEVIRMRYVDGMTLDEIGRELGITTQAAVRFCEHGTENLIRRMDEIRGRYNRPYSTGGSSTKRINCLSVKLSDTSLSKRILVSLTNGGVETIGDLLSFSKSDLLKFRNIHNEAVHDLSKLVESMGLRFPS